MVRPTLIGILLLSITAIAFPSRAPAEERVALVIGNSAYPSGPLSSPRYDAQAVEAKLRSLGFRVIRKTDLGREGLVDAIRDFGALLREPGTVGLFYYSGHGMQVNNRNYMIPIDADIQSDLDVPQYGVPIEDVLARMSLGESNPNMVILDACRNNPYEKRLKSTSDGLARMDASARTLIAFAAAAGQVAEAGIGGRLSPYTEALVEHIDQPYGNFIATFRAVQNAVYERSRRRQSPRIELSPGLTNFSFLEGTAPGSPVTGLPPDSLAFPSKYSERCFTFDGQRFCEPST